MKSESLSNTSDTNANGFDNDLKSFNDSSLILRDDNSTSLSISGASLTSTSNTNATPTLTATIDDKNEVHISSCRFFS